MAMTLAELEAEVLRLENRIITIENILNKVQTAMLNLASLEQLRRINLIRQTEIDELSSSITGLESEIALIKAEVFS